MDASLAYEVLSSYVPKAGDQRRALDALLLALDEAERAAADVGLLQSELSDAEEALGEAEERAGRWFEDVRSAVASLHYEAHGEKTPFRHCPNRTCRDLVEWVGEPAVPVSAC